MPTLGAATAADGAEPTAASNNPSEAMLATPVLIRAPREMGPGEEDDMERADSALAWETGAAEAGAPSGARKL